MFKILIICNVAKKIKISMEFSNQNVHEWKLFFYLKKIGFVLNMERVVHRTRDKLVWTKGRNNEILQLS